MKKLIDKLKYKKVEKEILSLNPATLNLLAKFTKFEIKRLTEKKTAVNKEYEQEIEQLRNFLKIISDEPSTENAKS